MKKILFLHGFFASGQCPMANALQEAFRGQAEVLTPDLPTNPDEAIKEIRHIIDQERPNLMIGNSCGAFYAQILSPITGIPSLLGNPHFRMSQFLQERIGQHQYKYPRYDGNQLFTITEELIQMFARIEEYQFSFCNPFYEEKVWGLFGEQDTLAHFQDEFHRHYTHSHTFPGAHTPTPEQVNTYYVPLARQLMNTCQPPTDGIRYFRHFKGGLYRYVRTAFDSETTERIVIYQALYGEHAYWVRPEKMFFEKITRNGKTFNRFTEIDLYESENLKNQIF